MKKVSFILLFIIFIICNHTAAEQLQTGSVHQYIVRQAWELAKYQRPDLEFTDLSQHIGNSEEGNGAWQKGLVVTGAFREDKEDPVYLYGGTLGINWQVTMTHFWNADDGDNFKWNYAGSDWENHLLGEGSKNMKTESLSFHENFNIASANNYSTIAAVEGRGKKWIYNSKYLIPAKSKIENDEYIQYQYRIDIGLNNNFLLSSDILKKGYSGFGIFIEPYIGKYISFKFELNHWIISSLKEDPDYTPFHKTSLWKRYYLLKLNIYPWDQVIFAQFGTLGTTSKIGSEKRGGFNFGIGYRLYKYNKVNLYLIADRSILGQFGAHGEIWDKNSELSMEISYSIKGIRRIKK